MLLFLIIFLLIGCVSASQDINETDNITESNKTTDFNYTIDSNITIKENTIDIEINSISDGEFTAYIDDKEIYSMHYNPYWRNSFKIPISNKINNTLGNHKLEFKFKFETSNDVHSAHAFFDESAINFDFNETYEYNNLTNYTFTFQTTLNILEKLEAIKKTINISEITVTHKDHIP